MAHTVTGSGKLPSEPAEASGGTAKKQARRRVAKRRNKKIDTSITVTYAQLVQQWYKMYETI